MTNLIEQNRDRIADLCRRYSVRRLDIFGSALRPDFDRDDSDLDFAVEFSNLTVKDAADRFLGLMLDLEDLFGRKIDLVSYSAIRNPYCKQVVDNTRVSLFDDAMSWNVIEAKLPVLRREVEALLSEDRT